MKDWSYKDAMRVAEARFQSCIRTHVLIPDPGRIHACSCGWKGSGPLHQWRDHVDTECIIRQVQQNRGANL